MDNLQTRGQRVRQLGMKKRHCKMENGKWKTRSAGNKDFDNNDMQRTHTHTQRVLKREREGEGGSGMLAKKNFSAVKTNLENLIKIAKLWQLIKFSRTRTTTQNGDQVESLKQATSQATHHSPQPLLLLPTHATPLCPPPNHSAPTVPGRRQV